MTVFAHERTLTGALADLRQCDTRLEVGASQIHDRRRAARRQLIDQVRVNHASEIGVGELRLERERTLLEP